MHSKNMILQKNRDSIKIWAILHYLTSAIYHRTSEAREQRWPCNSHLSRHFYTNMQVTKWLMRVENRITAILVTAEAKKSKQFALAIYG